MGNQVLGNGETSQKSKKLAYRLNVGSGSLAVFWVINLVEGLEEEISHGLGKLG